LAAVEGEGCEAGDCESGVALEDGVEDWVNLGWLVLAYISVIIRTHQHI
jgi:hypothetical protein